MARKRWRAVLILALVLVVIFGLAGQTFAVQPLTLQEGLSAAEIEGEYAPGEIIVKFKHGVSEDAIVSINSKHDTSVLYTSPYAGFRLISVPPDKTVPEMVDIYSQDPNVAYAEPNYIVHASWAPNDEHYPLQWHLDNAEYGGINMEAAWDIEVGDPNVIVAVLDTGVAYEDYDVYHLAPDLAATSFVAGYDFINDDSHPNDDNSHGTHVTGTIAQSTNNDIGVAGVAFNCSIMPIKVLDENGDGTAAGVADGIIWAADNGADVINMSLCGTSPSDTLENACAYAYDQGVILVCSSGNDGAATVYYPAAYDDYCIAVGATRYDEAVSYYSNTGASLDLVAPGGDLGVDQNGDGYGDGVLQQTFNPDTKDTSDFGYWFFEGTSMAASHVSGVAALLISHGTATNPDDVRAALQSTAEDHGAPGWDTWYGWGIVDAYAALMWTAEPNTPPVADDQSVTTTEDTPVAITLTGSDADGDPLTFSMVSGPSNGSLSETAPSVTYTPNLNFNGSDSFTFKVNDGTLDSNTATVFITVTSAPDQLTVTVATDKDTYTRGETVTIEATVTDGTKLVSGASVHVVVKDPRGRTAYQADKTTDGGTAVFYYTLSGWWARTGTYIVTATASKEGYEPGTGKTTFEVTRSSSRSWSRWR